MTGRPINLVAQQYIEAMQAITEAETAAERIALRNALIDHPVLGAFYQSPMNGPR